MGEDQRPELAVIPVNDPEQHAQQQDPGGAQRPLVEVHEEPQQDAGSQGDPEWELIELENVSRLPAVQWKLLNIRKMDKAKHGQALRRLEKCLG